MSALPPETELGSSAYAAQDYLRNQLSNVLNPSHAANILVGIERYVEARTRLEIVRMFKNENLFEIMMKAAGESK